MTNMYSLLKVLTFSCIAAKLLHSRWYHPNVMNEAYMPKIRMLGNIEGGGFNCSSLSHFHQGPKEDLTE